MLQRLEELTNLCGVSGDEGSVRAYIKEQAAPYADEMWVDNMGNLFVHKKGNGKKIVVCAHMDEVGMMVRGIRDDGLLVYQAPDIDAGVVVSKRVLIGKNKVPGVIGAKAIHLQTDEEFEKIMPHEKLYIDIGAKDKADAEKHVKKGEYICFDTKFERFGDGLIRAKALDDRTGCAIILEMLKQDYDCDFYAAFTVQEERGLRGASVVAYALEGDLTLIIEGTTANDMPKVPSHKSVTTVGDGAAITIMDARTITLPKMVNALKETAQKHDIPYQMRKGTKGGTDAGVIHKAGKGSITGGISVPCRYIHSTISVCSEQDFVNAFRLADAFIKDKKYEEVLS
ncbi:MAG: M42 family metallopeptidase [Clostridia bacterium]|nr:M42 family metallopeptidase [Clostridia bacterium]